MESLRSVRLLSSSVSPAPDPAAVAEQHPPVRRGPYAERGVEPLERPEDVRRLQPVLRPGQRVRALPRLGADRQPQLPRRARAVAAAVVGVDRRGVSAARAARDPGPGARRRRRRLGARQRAIRAAEPQRLQRLRGDLAAAAVPARAGARPARRGGEAGRSPAGRRRGGRGVVVPPDEGPDAAGRDGGVHAVRGPRRGAFARPPRWWPAPPSRRAPAARLAALGAGARMVPGAAGGRLLGPTGGSRRSPSRACWWRAAWRRSRSACAIAG